MTSQEHKELLIKYLLAKVELEDWHGVADAAMDLREVEIEIRFDELLRKGNNEV